MNVEECSVCEPNLALILHQKFNRFFLRNFGGIGSISKMDAWLRRCILCALVACQSNFVTCQLMMSQVVQGLRVNIRRNFHSIVLPPKHFSNAISCKPFAQFISALPFLWCKHSFLRHHRGTFVPREFYVVT